MPSLCRNVLVSTLFVILGGPGFVLVYFPRWITRFRVPPHEPAWQMLFAVALILLGLAPLFESIARFIRIGRGTLVPTTPTEHLVVSGLYRYVRNPMYVGVLTVLVGEVALFASRDLLNYTALVWLCIHLFVCFYEEPTLTRRYGEQYLAYKRNVPRWLPRLAPWKSNPGEGGNLSA
jgi:protein-S-isoprenylcysteine O-methyltransferase Ste14